jgi:Mn-containing catalase
MILRIDRLAAEMPPPSTPDPAGAAAVQELLTAINTMLTGAGEKGDLPEPHTLLNSQHVIAGGSAALVQDSNGKPWNGVVAGDTGGVMGKVKDAVT